MIKNSVLLSHYWDPLLIFCSRKRKEQAIMGNFFWNQGMWSSCNGKSREESSPVMRLVIPGPEAECPEENLMT